jgi:dihydrofolate reductase
MRAILSADSNWGIGYKNELLVRVPEDMKFFRQTTLGGVVVMGRKTLDSLPGRKPLKDRVNIVVSTDRSLNVQGITICGSLKELLGELAKYPPEDVFVIGGESLYRQLLPYCSEVYVTKFHKAYEADRFFPNLDHDRAWTPEVLDNSLTYNDLEYSRIKYVNNKTIQFT